MLNLPRGNFLVSLHLDVERLASIPLSQSILTTVRRKQRLQPSVFGSAQWQEEPAASLAVSIARLISFLNFDPVELYRSKTSCKCNIS